jgi:hypothetical protein
MGRGIGIDPLPAGSRVVAAIAALVGAHQDA